ncbi:hypothetical protein Ddc_17634 [Ditylenchus destructor]|nr:hypothetical protein Ddc_17634 [Ditylenchus destructor]
MTYLPNEVLTIITKFLPTDDITDLMLLSRNFNALVTPRLQKIDQEVATINQSIESFITLPAPGGKWNSQLILKQFEPSDSKAKERMKEVFENENTFLYCLQDARPNNGMLEKLKEKMSLERFDDPTFMGILGALISVPKFRQDYNISLKFSKLYKLEVITFKVMTLDREF